MQQTSPLDNVVSSPEWRTTAGVRSQVYRSRKIRPRTGLYYINP